MDGRFMMLVLYGPTATGKTNLAIEIAKKENGEIISADSRQIYKSLDIGTGKVSPNSKIKKYGGYWVVDGVNIYGFDIKNPQETFSVSDFIKFAQIHINKIQRRGKTPIIVGGTGFYIKSLLYGIETIGISPNPELRNKLEKLTQKELYNLLLKTNKKKALSLNNSDKQNPRRLIRAIEIYSKKRSPKNTDKIPTFNDKMIVLTAPNDILYKRADSWLAKRLKLGLEGEISDLIAQGTDPLWLKSLGLEYRWITKSLLGEISRGEAITRLKGDIHSYIRRQKTFIKQFEDIKIFDISAKYWKGDLLKSTGQNKDI